MGPVHAAGDEPSQPQSLCDDPSNHKYLFIDIFDDTAYASGPVLPPPFSSKPLKNLDYVISVHLKTSYFLFF